MPELPEVEVTRRSFAGRIAGACILDSWFGKPLRWPLGASSEMLKGRYVLAVRRRGKYLLLDLDEGMLMLHLGMSGSVRFAPDLPPRGPHDHFELRTTKGILRLNDPRRFGAVMLVEGENDPRAAKLLDRLGVEPIDDQQVDLDILTKAFRCRPLAIKQVLLSGTVIAGLGNIYASEVLFHARIHPETPASGLTRVQVGRIWRAARDVVDRAIEQGGSSLRNYSDAKGRNGNFQFHTMVYGRRGQPCHVCGQSIEMVRQGQRATYFCGYCQKRK